MKVTVRSFLNTTKDLSRAHTRRILQYVLNLPAEDLFKDPDRPISEQAQQEIESCLNALRQEKPLSRILGLREFWSLSFQLSLETLDPRQDTEILIEKTLNYKKDRNEPFQILDLGTGSGCILITLLTLYPFAQGIGVDVSEKALETAKINATFHHVEKRAHFIKSSWFAKIDPTQKFDLIISNPPYISEHDYFSLPKNVKNFDPKKALTPGPTGLESYESIIQYAPSFLKKNGLLILEIGDKAGVETLLKKEGFSKIACYNDLARKPRCFVSRFF